MLPSEQSEKNGYSAKTVQKIETIGNSFGSKPLQPLVVSPDLKAVTIHGPWAWAIIAGYKTVENRSWPTNHRGTLAIHAGKSSDSDEIALQLFRELGITSPKTFKRGVIIGTVQLVDILSPVDYLNHYGDSPYHRRMAEGPLCWVLKNPVPCIPLRCPGNFQLWNVANQLKK